MPSGSVLYSGATASAIQQHYDASNEFFALWLDEGLTYSCARWEPGDTLEAAQVRKLDLLLDLARARGAGRLLDVGCGWGSLLRRATGAYDVREAVGLTLSPNQARWSTERGLPAGVEIRLENWVDHQPAEPYGAIVSIGAFEHFARFGLAPAERLEAYRRFFRFCRQALPPGGRLVVQTNIKGNNNRLDRATVREMMFIIESIFPQSEMPRMSELVAASETLFEVLSVRNDGPDYIRTLTEWSRRLRHRRDDAVALVGERMVADYEHYLAAAARHFERRHLGLARVVYEAV
ncbi:class I SAM-dependent methyltransferase [Micromonospora sp. NPDC005220]|uniref:class I SAM-dependent methyltransferase n=1 Tax=Micromonospora sp. NPDC005220 TaxID=3155589 RepID=UPI0033B7AAEE